MTQKIFEEITARNVISVRKIINPQIQGRLLTLKKRNRKKNFTKVYHYQIVEKQYKEKVLKETREKKTYYCKEI